MNEGFANHIEISLLAPLLGVEELKIACRDAQRQGCAAVSVSSSRVAEAYEYLGSSDVKVSCLIGFPFGSMDADAKRYETEVAVDNSAHEIELVWNLSRFRERDYRFVLREIRDVVEAADERPVKVLVETGLWKPAELEEACRLLLDSGATCLSTSTGVNGMVAGIREIALLRHLLGDKFGLKASGLADFDGAAELIHAGATRLGDVGLRMLSVI